MINKLKKYFEYLLPFIVSLTIVIIFCLVNKIDIHNSFIVNDLHVQYTSLMSYLKNALTG